MTTSETVSSEEGKSTSAKSHFDEGRYDECAETLSALPEALNAKVQQNLVLCKFLKKSPDDLESMLDNLYTIEGKMNKETEEDEEVDEVERSVLTYNISLVHYQTKNYNKAIVILEKLFKIIEPLEDQLAYKVCFLLVECYLCTYNVEGATMVTYYLDKLMASKATAEATDAPLDVEIHRARMHQYKTRLYALQKCLKACKREIKNVLSVSGTTASSLFLKSEFEYLRNNFKKSAKLLNSAPKSCPSKENIPTLYYNNFGCMHFKMYKYNLGVLYMSRAIEANTKAVKAAPQGCNSVMYSINHNYQLLYNYGILLLHAGQPKAAFKCLTQASSVYTRNPRLWLRIAECAIAVVNLGEDCTEINNSKSETVRSIIGSGVYRKTVLNTTFQNCPKQFSADLTDQAPSPTLTYAVLCLENALDLLPDNNEPVSCLPAAPLKDTSSLRASILCNTAYVWLCIGDPLQALTPAQQLANQVSAPKVLRLLGHLYSAEALLLLNRSNEAMHALSPESIEAVKSVPCHSKKEVDEEGSCSPVPPSSDLSVEEVHNTIILNTVALYCMRRDLNKAKRILIQHLSTLNQDEVPPQATMLLVYIELRQGNCAGALCILKQQQNSPGSLAPA